MRVLVCGGRNYNDRAAIARALLPYRPAKAATDVSDHILILGGATGADSIAEEWADVWGVRKRVFPAKWHDLKTPPIKIKRRADGTLYNALAGFARNQRMLDEGKPDLVLAFPGGPGTADMVRRAKAAGVKVVEVTP